MPEPKPPIRGCPGAWASAAPSSPSSWSSSCSNRSSTIGWWVPRNRTASEFGTPLRSASMARRPVTMVTSALMRGHRPIRDAHQRRERVDQDRVAHLVHDARLQRLVGTVPATRRVLIEERRRPRAP